MKTSVQINDQEMELVSPEAYLQAAQKSGKKTAVYPENIERIPDVCYGEVNGKPLLLDCYSVDRIREGLRPALIFVHGGGWSAGSKESTAHLHTCLALKTDALVISINYRLSGEAPYPAALQDVRCAIRWLRSVADQYQVDPEQIAIFGGSAGAHLSALAALAPRIPLFEGNSGHETYSSSVSKLIVLNGTFDFAALCEHRKGVAGDKIAQFLGCEYRVSPLLYQEASPASYIQSESPSTLIMHGEDDQVLPVTESKLFHKRLREAGVHSEIEIYPGKGHGWFHHAPDFMIVIDRITKFLGEQFNLTR